jgi:hypothetical protein
VASRRGRFSVLSCNYPSFRISRQAANPSNIIVEHFHNSPSRGTGNSRCQPQIAVKSTFFNKVAGFHRQVIDAPDYRGGRAAACPAQDLQCAHRFGATGTRARLRLAQAPGVDRECAEVASGRPPSAVSISSAGWESNSNNKGDSVGESFSILRMHAIVREGRTLPVRIRCRRFAQPSGVLRGRTASFKFLASVPL